MSVSKNRRIAIQSFTKYFNLNFIIKKAYFFYKISQYKNLNSASMKFLLLLGLFTLTSASFLMPNDSDEVFLKFLSDFDIELSPFDIYQARKEIFMKNLMEIREHNQRFLEGKEHFEMGLNQFTHLTIDEFAEFADCVEDPPEAERVYSTEHLNYNFSALPKAIDWRSTGKVSKVKNQVRKF